MLGAAAITAALVSVVSRRLVSRRPGASTRPDDRVPRDAEERDRSGGLRSWWALALLAPLLAWVPAARELGGAGWGVVAVTAVPLAVAMWYGRRKRAAS